MKTVGSFGIAFILGLILLLASPFSTTRGATNSNEPETSSTDAPKDTETTQPETTSNDPPTKTKTETETPSDTATNKPVTTADPKTEPTTTTPPGLPTCDGSFQDCKTKNGDVCKAGEKSDQCECADDMSDCPNNPAVLKPETKVKATAADGGPDGDCLFKPELPKCASHDQECPAGFNNNEDGNCVPQHDRCPKGFHGHEDDETGRCIPDSVPCQKGFIRDPDFPTCSSIASVCRDHPELKACGGKGEDDHDHKQHHDHDNDVRVIINNIHKGSTGNSHSLTAGCFDAIKTAWLGKIERGQNSQVDTFIDKCLNVGR